MATFLFDDIVFGPVNSRRLGNSLGINLLPADSKVCSFNCVYCECGWTQGVSTGLPSGYEIKKRMHKEFKRLHENHVPVDVITFAGNGEPTLHPEFDLIIDHTIKLRDDFFPGAEIAVLTNATMLHKQSVNDALQKIEMPLLKLDSAIESTARAMNQPQIAFDFKKHLENIRNFPGKRIIQTMFVRFQKQGVWIDNTTAEELNAWLQELDRIHPDLVMVYSIARDTPDSTVKAVPKSELEKIAGRAEDNGHKTQVN